MICKKNMILSFLIVMTIGIIIIGGTTRLTRSGLSITEWKPITGVIPPIDEFDWQVEFNKYKKTPEFKKNNSHFELQDFKKIFFWEWLHRIIGRLIFLAYLIIGIYLIRKKYLSIKTLIKFLSVIAIQGVMGWIMVKSGLKDNPYVNPYFLSVHYFLAVFLIFLTLKQFSYKTVAPSFLNYEKFLFKIIGAVLALQIFLGNLTSGFRAGFYSNTYPLMNDRFFPQTKEFSFNLFYNIWSDPAWIHWLHRWNAIVLIVVVLLGYNFFRIYKLKEYLYFLILILMQFTLGVILIIKNVAFNFAIIHQLLGTLILLHYFIMYLAYFTHDHIKN